MDLNNGTAVLFPAGRACQTHQTTRTWPGPWAIGGLLLAATNAGTVFLINAASFAGLALGPLAGLRWRFRSILPRDLLPAGDSPAPHLTSGQPLEGPVLVSVEYWARPGLEGELMAALEQTRYSRRRTGATSW
jgi:Transmembrane secretion effector